MDYSDNSPERRNLTLTSVAFILFYIGDGTLTENSLALPLINVEFHNLGALKAAAWATLTWFAYRYLLVMRGDYYKLRGPEIGSIEFPQRLIEPLWNRASSSLMSKDPTASSCSFDRCLFSKDNPREYNRRDPWKLVIDATMRIGPAGNAKQGRREELETTWVVWLLFIATAGYTALTKPTVSQYITPLLFLNIAVTGPLWQHLFDK